MLPAGACKTDMFDPNPRCRWTHGSRCPSDKLTPNYKTIGIYTGRFNNAYRREHLSINMNIHGLLLGKIKDPSVLGSIGNKLTGAGVVTTGP